MSKRILIVDDDPTWPSLTSRWIKREFPDTEIVVETNPKSAVLRLREHWDLVLSDVEMPHMNGFDFLARVREAHPQVLLAMMSGADRYQNDPRLNTLGVKMFWSKAASYESVFLGKLRKLLD